MTILAKPAIIWTALIYLALVVVIGIWAVRRTKSAKGFFIAGQGIGLLVTALATGGGGHPAYHPWTFEYPDIDTALDALI